MEQNQQREKVRGTKSGRNQTQASASSPHGVMQEALSFSNRYEMLSSREACLSPEAQGLLLEDSHLGTLSA